MGFHYCCICRGPIGITQPGQRASRENYVSEKDEEWCNYCRVIYKPPNQSGAHRVSGVCYYHNTTAYAGYEVPVRKSATKIRSRAKVGRRLRFNCLCVPGEKCDDGPRHCYQVHSYCWNWTERLLGPLSGNSLDLLVTALESAWKIGPTVLILHPPSCCTLCVKALEENQIEISDRERFAPICDPARIPALQRALGLSKNSQIDSRRPWKPVRFKTRDSGLLSLPLELKLLVLDSLSDLLDVGNAVAAFQWKLPDLYGKSRVPFDLLYELNHTSADGLNWERLFIELGQLYKETPWGLENRQRILQLIYLVRSRFSEIAEQNKSTGVIEASDHKY